MLAPPASPHSHNNQSDSGSTNTVSHLTDRSASGSVRSISTPIKAMFSKTPPSPLTTPSKKNARSSKEHDSPKTPGTADEGDGSGEWGRRGSEPALTPRSMGKKRSSGQLLASFGSLGNLGTLGKGLNRAGTMIRRTASEGAATLSDTLATPTRGKTRERSASGKNTEDAIDEEPSEDRSEDQGRHTISRKQSRMGLGDRGIGLPFNTEVSSTRTPWRSASDQRRWNSTTCTSRHRYMIFRLRGSRPFASKA